MGTHAGGVIKVNAAALLEALGVVVPKGDRRSRRRKVDAPVTLKFDASRSVLEIFESRHAAKGYEIEASGAWPDQVQIEGRVLRNLISRFRPEASVEMTVTPDDLAAVHGGTKATLRRLDASDRRPIKLVPVKGPESVSWPKIKPDPHEKRAEWDDTWDFSARVPIPQHRKPTDK